MTDRQLMRGWSRILLLGCILTTVMMVAGTDRCRAEPRHVTAAVLRHWPPQYEIDNHGRPTGFAIDILTQIAAAADLQVTYKVFDSWEKVEKALRTGQADLIPNQGITLERQKQIAFTSPVETFPIVIFVRHDTIHIFTPDDLAGHTVATVRYNIGTRLIAQRRDLEHKVLSNANEALLELLAGQVDALVYPGPVLMKLAITAGLEDRIKMVGPPLMEIKRAIAVRKGDQALFNLLDSAVSRLVPSKRYEQIYAKWYGRPKPFWTPKKVVLAMGTLLFIIALGYNIRVTRINRRLGQSMADQARAEAALRENEEKYRLMVENQNDLIIKMDCEFRMVFASPSCCDTFGMAPEILAGRDFPSLVHPDEREKVQLALQSLLVAPHICRHEERILTPKGLRWFAWSNNAVMAEDGRIYEIVGVGRDTTDRKEAELRLQVSEEKFRAIFEQSGDAVVLLDSLNFALVDFNDAAYQPLGYTKEEFSKVTFKDLLVPDGADTVAKTIRRLIASRDQPVEARLRTKSGEIRHYRMKQQRLTFNDGKYLLEIWHDITDLKMLEANLVQSQKMEAIGTLAGGIAHDFNNILSIIIGNAELAVEDIADGHAAKNRLREILTASIRAKEVVHQLLSFSRQDEEKRSPVLLGPIIEESLQLLRATIPSTIDIHKNISDPDLTILADATRIHQVLINLCTNAAQAIAESSGKIIVSLAPIRLDEYHADRYGLPAGAYAQITVEDTGCGIDPEIIDRIFDPYFTTKEAHQGTGMGLSIVHSIVSRHEGAINVESPPGYGTTFRVFLPLSSQKPTSKIELPGSSAPNHASILLVDDEPSLVRLGKQCLEKLGYSVLAVDDPLKALNRFKANPTAFDLIITDMTMPNMTGDVLANEILKINPRMRVIICSGYHRKVDPKRICSLGARAFLQKPFDMKTLAIKVRQALG